MTPFATTNELFAALADERPGDVVNALSHALQCAWLLQQQWPHDGNFSSLAWSTTSPARSSRDRRDAMLRLAANWFGGCWALAVAALVAGHVAAKRWLVSREPTYRNRLSDNSRATLARQGEGFSALELAEFEASQYAAHCVLLRRADDNAKQPGRIVPSLGSWRPLVEKYASRR